MKRYAGERMVLEAKVNRVYGVRQHKQVLNTQHKILYGIVVIWL